MRDVLPALLRALDAGEGAAIATVVRTWGSSPRPPGSALGLTSAGRVVGSVSGGCVEGAVVEVATEVLRTGAPRLAEYGVADADALDAGLPCGGTIMLLVEPVTRSAWPGLPGIVADLESGQAVAIATLLPGRASDPVPAAPPSLARGGPAGGRGPGGHLAVRASGSIGTLGDPRLDAVVAAAARRALSDDDTGIVELTGDREAFVAVLAPSPRLVIVGATSVGAALAEVGRLLGFRVSVVDPRPAFATTTRVPGAHEVVADWPHRWLAGQVLDSRSAVCVLSHDARVDLPVLAAALRSPAGYVGLLGSRRTQADRAAGLRAAAVPEPDIGRLRGPIGLDLGARTPEEVAVCVAAELVAHRRGGSGIPLSALAGPIHGAGVR